MGLSRWGFSIKVPFEPVAIRFRIFFVKIRLINEDLKRHNGW